MRTIAWLVFCASALGAALAHLAIDFVGDYALAHDSYDHIQHGSRVLVSGVAILIALVLAARGLRVCCEIAARHRTRLLRPALRVREILRMVGGAAVISVAIVPAMEYLDGWLSGTPVRQFSDAFGGSIPLGLVTTVCCAAVVALFVCLIAHWLISHRDSIAAVIETFSNPVKDCVLPGGHDVFCAPFTLHRRRAIYALRLAKRGPPAARFA